MPVAGIEMSCREERLLSTSIVRVRRKEKVTDGERFFTQDRITVIVYTVKLLITNSEIRNTWI